jgi:hypothetical protein
MILYAAASTFTLKSAVDLGKAFVGAVSNSQPTLYLHRATMYGARVF